MSPRARSKNPPVAPRKKRLLHALYLAQPFLQFAALMAVLFVLGRCSPLASSTDKALNKLSANGAINSHTEHGDSSANEEDIKREMKDISSFEELPLISQSDFASKVVLPNSIEAEKGTDIAGVQNIFRLRAKQSGTQKNVRILIVRLLKTQKDDFFRSGSIRLDLAQILSAHMEGAARKTLFGEIHKISRGELSAKAYLVMSDDDMASPDAIDSIPVAAKMQMAIFPNDERAWLQMTRVDPRNPIDDARQKLIESTKDKSVSMALVLE